MSTRRNFGAHFAEDAGQHFLLAGMCAGAEQDALLAIPAGAVPPRADFFFLGDIDRVESFALRHIVLHAAEIEDGFRREAGERQP